MTVSSSPAGALRRIMAPVDVLDDPALTERYRSDWTARFVATGPVTVVRPRSVDDLAAVIAWCHDNDTAVVPQGGNTGLVGGSVPLHGEIVVTTEHLSGIESVDSATGQLTAHAGTPLADVQAAARAEGWRYGVDIASRDSATIGGTVATNAGGLRVLRYGATRAQVVGVEAVTGTGTVVDAMRGTLRDNTGYHLPSLVTGSEGTLGVITKVRVRLVPAMPERTTALVRFDDPRAAAVAVESVRGMLPTVESAEVFFAPGLELVCRVMGYEPPFGETSGGYVLIEVADSEDRTEALGAAVEAMAGVADVAVAQDAPGRARLWRYRERHTEAIATVGRPHKLDVAVPLGSLADFIEAATATVRDVAPAARVWLFGHGGEAAVHVNVTGLGDDDDTVDEAVLRLVAEFGGSISAEHGIGTAKLGLIGLARSPEELSVLRGIKAAFDPKGIMNPHVLVPAS